MRTRITLKSIAERTGLALSTISMALNDHPDINEDTKRSVRRMAEELNYRPHPAARALARKKTALIGLVIQNVMSSFYPEIIQGVEDVALQNSGSTILCGTNEQTDKEVEYLGVLLDRRVDGIILEPHSGQQDRRLIEEIRQQGIPIITILRRYPDQDFPSVVVDNVTGAYEITRYLIQRGHRRIGHLQGPDHADTTEARLHGFQQAMQEAGLDCPPESMVKCEFNPDAGRRGMARLLSQYEGMSAVFAASDSVAMGALSEAQQRGIPVPSGMSIVGFDGLFFAQLVEPKLTTVNQPRYEIGEIAAKMLMQRIEGKPVERVTLYPKLLIGTSA
jgi:LacI family transcriptional regulator